VRLRVGGAAVGEVAAEGGGRAVGGVALAGDGTVAYARRVLVRGRARVEIVVIRPNGGSRVVARSSAYSGGAKAELPRLAMAGRLLAFRLRSGQRGRSEAIWVADLAGGGAKRIVRVNRQRGRLLDPGVAPGRVVWTRSDLGGDGRSLVRSRVVSAGVRAG
jgi:hypothetical protein